MRPCAFAIGLAIVLVPAAVDTRAASPEARLLAALARLQQTEGRPHWHLEPPRLERVVLRGERTSWLPSLEALPVFLREPDDRWPAADVSIDPADISFERAEPNDDAGTVLVRATIRNAGDAPATVTIDLSAGTDVERVVRRRFVCDLPAHGSVHVPSASGIQRNTAGSSYARCRNRTARRLANGTTSGT